MKLASISVVTVSLLVSLASVGCSSGRTHPTTDTGVNHMDAGHINIPDSATDANSLTHDVGSIVRDTGGGGHDTGMATQRDSGACTAHCTSASACTSACGAVAGGGIRCCDTATSTCFVTHAAMCPAASPDSGSMSY